MRGSHRYKSKQNSDIVLVPQPADDPNDPLNWPAWKKNMALIAALFSVFLPAWVVGGVGSGLLLVIEDFDSTLNATVDALVTWPALLLGIAVQYPPVKAPLTDA